MGFFEIWAQNFFEGLNKSASVIGEIYIYIDSEGFRQIHWKK